MDSLIEKITLYDVIGYWLPGSLLLFIIDWNKIFSIDSMLSSEVEYKVFAVLFFAIFGYILGIMVSEVAWYLKNFFQKNLL